jgi:hypothetical protein
MTVTCVFMCVLRVSFLSELFSLPVVTSGSIVAVLTQ